jgi:hypothetical protein
MSRLASLEKCICIAGGNYHVEAPVVWSSEGVNSRHAMYPWPARVASPSIPTLMNYIQPTGSDLRTSGYPLAILV